MKLNEYLEMLAEKVENISQSAVVEYPIRQDMPAELISKFQPEVWTCRKVNNEYYVFYQGHFLNVSQLKQELNNLYAQSGYLGKGLDKLDERALMTYATSKTIIKSVFKSAFTVEIDPKDTASYLFNTENFNFTRGNL